MAIIFHVSRFTNIRLILVMNSFIGCFVVLCDFHREQAWQRWLSATKNGMRKMIAPALCHMRRIASSDTVKECDENIKSLYGSPVWNVESSKKFKIYFESTWLPLKKVILTFLE